jgi:hypothetical protein
VIFDAVSKHDVGGGEHGAGDSQDRFLGTAPAFDTEECARRLSLLKTPLSPLLQLSTGRLLIDVVRSHFVARNPALVGPISGQAAPRDPRPATPAPCSRAVTPSAGASDASRPSALGVVVTLVA